MKASIPVTLLAILSFCAATGCFWPKKSNQAHTPPVPRSAQKSTAAQRTTTHQRTPSTSKPRPSQPAPAAASAKVARPADPPSPSPTLREILTPEQQQRLSREVDRSMASARRSLVYLSGRNLTSEQSETMRMARSFLSQAEKARQSDLGLAAQLAHRAEVLANSLADSR